MNTYDESLIKNAIVFLLARQLHTSKCEMIHHSNQKVLISTLLANYNHDNNCSEKQDF